MIKESLNKLRQIKLDIKQAIEKKGGVIDGSFGSYADSIAKIPIGDFLVPAGTKFAYSNLERFPDNYVWTDSKNWDDLSYMFYRCENLKEIPPLEVSNATNLADMFSYTGDGTSDIDLSNWSNDKYPIVEYMFRYANYKDVKLPKDFKLTDMNYMFCNYGGKKLDVSNLTSEVTTMQYCFYNTELEELNVGDMPNLKTLRHTFSSSSNLRKLNGFNCSYVKDTSDAFKGLYALQDFGGFINLNYSIDVVQCYSLSYESLINILNGLQPLTTSKSIRFDQENVNMLTDDDIAIATNKGWTVQPAKSVLQTINVTALNEIPSNLKRINPRVYDCQYFSKQWGDESTKRSNLPCYTNVTTAEISLRSTIDASYMFADSYVYFVTLIDTSNVKSLKGAFYDAPFLKSVTMTDDVSNLEDVTDMFAKCSSQGTFFYNPKYDYSKIINVLPEGWVAKPIE